MTLLGERFQQGRLLVAPLVMFFQVTNHLALLIVLARLQERPIVAAILATAGGLANFALALWLMPKLKYAKPSSWLSMPYAAEGD